MSRADDLRALIATVEAVGDFHMRDTLAAFTALEASRAYMAARGDLNAVRDLETPLRSRGWLSFVEGNGDGSFYAELQRDGRKVFGRSTTEARARLLAVLRALLHEAEAR